jgi:hypothetical protein
MYSTRGDLIAGLLPANNTNENTSIPDTEVGMSRLDLRSLYREFLDHLDGFGIRPAAIEQFRRASICGTAEMGGELFRSETGEERIVYHTCKSRCCPSCGYFRSLLWQVDATRRLPNIPFTSAIFTMRGHLWKIFRDNRELLAALPVIGAGVLRDWARAEYGADVAILVVPHTFGAKLNFNVHLHIIVSRVGLTLGSNRLVYGIEYPPLTLTERWQANLLSYLELAVTEGLVRSDLEQGQLLASIRKERGSCWVKLVRPLNGLHNYLRYMSRYLRRQPIANNRLLPSPDGFVRFHYWQKLPKNSARIMPGDTVTRFGTVRRLQTEEVTVQEFFKLLADQVQDDYSHGVRYFGLLAPTSRPRYTQFMRLLGQTIVVTSGGQHWAYWIRRTFKRNPLVDSNGRPMRWVSNIPPKGRGGT